MSLAGIEPKMSRFRPFSANCYRFGRSLVKTRKKWIFFRTLKVLKFSFLIKKNFLIKKTRRARSARRVLMENEVFSQMFVKLKNVSHFHHFSQVPRSHCLDGFLQWRSQTHRYATFLIRRSEIINLSYDFQQWIAFPSKTTNVPSLLKFMSHFCANCNTQKSQTDKTHNNNNNNYYYYYSSYYYSTTTTTTTTTYH